MDRVTEFQYRRLFGLSKKEMGEEPFEDVAINLKIQNLLTKKEQRDRDIVEMKAERGMKT